MTHELAGFTHEYIDHGGTRTLLLLHGTGGDERDLMPIAEQIDSTASILAPRGRVSESGMNRYFARFPDGSFDTEDLARETAALAAFVQAAAETYGINTHHITTLGYSNGANIALSLLVSDPALIRSHMLLRPSAAAVPDQLPALTDTRIFIAIGLHDPLTPVDMIRTRTHLLSRMGAAVTLHASPTGHELNETDIASAASWFDV